MKRIIPILLFLVGLGFLIYAVSLIWNTQAEQKKSFQKAQKLIEERIESEESPSPDDFHIETGDVIGILHLPLLDKKLPIISGTNEDELERGVGHYTTTALPDQGDQILLSGHRDTVFRGLGELQIGDTLVVEMSYGGTYTYEIFDTDIVDADDRTVIRSTAPDEILTLSTCYPFSFIGNAPDRYIIYAERIYD
ncbi:class D sortase [Bacillus sp. FJAT-49711]|uniref:class D sortase n=1 Tax=Bacillus sp. FJAT-49711 TaxID=2833585 RepID=UPI001BC9C1F7|nr:class D sortase [Bacillus sp. FJAT-49711]MBS4220329.1 class D sortase [Bacillus sp. FJAT-49711]